jgi:alpha-galactosidase
MMLMMRWKLLLIAASLSASASILLSCFPGLNYTISNMNSAPTDNQRKILTAVAVHLTEKTDSDGFPTKPAWQKAPANRFYQDWRGENPDPRRATEVSLLWTPETLFLRFHCNYQNLSVFSDARADGWRNELWDRDVAETFLQPDASDPLVYREFEVSPNGYWIDLAVSHGRIEELHSGLRRRVVLDEKAKTWIAELVIPMKCLTLQFNPKHSWRANFYRIEGGTEPRFYSAWSPTYSLKPNFHVPAAFGTLVFREQE